MKNPVVMTLDAGGTNFVFSAICNEKEIVEPFTLPSYADNLDKCLRTIIQGFEQVKTKLSEAPQAISFAFPGPADYARGIIGDLGNLPGFRGGVALGPMLRNHFGVPVYINNDGDLFAYGEAIYGILPTVNQGLSELGSHKQFANLFGVTLGTGFGGGLVTNKTLFAGDNGAAAEVWLLRDPFNASAFAEESISARVITGVYGELTGSLDANLTPHDIFLIAKGEKPGNRDNALQSFHTFGTALGQALCEIVTIIDGLVVIGGGLANARELFFPAMLQQLNGTYLNKAGSPVNKLVMKAYDLHNEETFPEFAHGQDRIIQVPFSEETIHYDPVMRTGIAVSSLGASKAIMLGAYAFAVNALRRTGG